MSDPNDLGGVTDPLIPADVADAILRGGPLAPETPDALAEVGSLVGAARRPAEGDELASLQSIVASFQRELVTSGHDSTARNHRMIHKLLKGKAAATIGAIALLSAGAAAAAGVVPTPFDGAHSKPSLSAPKVTTDDTDESTEETTGDTTGDTAAEKVADVDATADGDDTEGTGEAVGPDATGPAKFGLCTAWTAQHRDDGSTESSVTESSEAEAADDEGGSVAFANLEQAATDAGMSVEDFCADATPGGKDGTGKPEDSPSLTAPGQGDDNPSATAPGQGDDNPSATAPGKSDDNPSVTAPPEESEDNPSATAPGKDKADSHGKPGDD